MYTSLFLFIRCTFFFCYMYINRHSMILSLFFYFIYNFRERKDEWNTNHVERVGAYLYELKGG